MLTRESCSRSGKPSENNYVEEQAKVARQNASSVLPSASVSSRQVRSDTKRVHTDTLASERSRVPSGLSLTVPRGDADTAHASALSEQSDPRVTSRIFVLSKHKNRCCAYCSTTNTPLQIEHIQPTSKGGSNRISNLCLACEKCNQKKSDLPIEDFLKKKPVLLAQILKQAKAPLKDAAAVNSTRKALVKALEATGLPIETASGGETKYNRTRLGIPKTHALDAFCVGSIEQVGRWNLPTLEIKSTGRGSYQRTRVDASGFPRGYLIRSKSAFGFQTGDQVRAVVSKGKKIGIYVGRVAIRATGSFNIQTPTKLVQGISHKYITLIVRNDGYQYGLRATLPPLA